MFRKYIFQHQVPFPANLLVSYYQPWKSYPYPEYPNGPPNKPMGFDNLRIHYPLRMLSTTQIQQGIAPLWNPYNFSGNTLLATYQSAIFHPMTWLYLIIPGIDAWSVIVLLQPFLGLLFFYVFLREIGYSRLASVLGGVTFGLSGTIVVWWEEAYVAGYTALGLPLTLFTIERFQKHPNWRQFALVVFGFVWLIVSGWFQFTLYSFVFICFWCWYRVWIVQQIKAKLLFPILGALLTAIFLSGIHLIPAIEAYINSPRASTDAKYLFDGYLMPLAHLVTLIAPDFFGNPATYSFFGKGFYYEHVMYFGIVSLFFVLYALHVISVRDKKAILGYVFIIFLSLGLALPTSWFFLYTLQLPLISVLIPSRIFFLSTVMAALLAADGMEQFREKPQLKKIGVVHVLFAICLVLLWIFVWHMKRVDPVSAYATVSLRNLILPSLLVCSIILLQLIAIKKAWRRAALWTLVLIACLGAVYMVNKYLYFSESRFVYPETPLITALRDKAGIHRVWGFGSAELENNFSTMLGLYTVEGYDSFFIGRYGELLAAAAHNGTLAKDIPRADARISAQSDGGTFFVTAEQEKLLALMGVKYIFGMRNETKGKVPFNGFSPLTSVWNDDRYAIYESGTVLPRAFFVDTYTVIQDDQEVLRAMFDPKTDLRRTVILEDDPHIPAASASAYTAQIRTYTPQRILIETQSEQTALLFLSDVFFPGWKVYIDGVQHAAYRANYAFRGAVVPAGNHRVEWRYDPDSWRYGWISVAVGITCLAGSWLFYVRRLNRQRKGVSASRSK